VAPRSTTATAATAVRRALVDARNDTQKARASILRNVCAGLLRYRNLSVL